MGTFPVSQGTVLSIKLDCSDFVFVVFRKIWIMRLRLFKARDVSSWLERSFWYLHSQAHSLGNPLPILPLSMLFRKLAQKHWQLTTLEGREG